MATRVLVVEDDALIAACMIDALTRLGHTAFEASSGLQAVEMLRSDDTFDLVLTDLHMERMSGYELAEQVRAMHPSLPILLITADEYASADEECTMPVLLKPYTRYQLAQAMHQVFRLH